MYDLTDKVALVTGGSRGLGRAIALALAQQGADVGVNYRGNADAAAEVVTQIRTMGRAAIAIQGDTSAGREACEAIVKAAIDEFGKVDILVNNAGITRDNLLMRMSEEEWDAVIQVHLKGTFAPSRHAAAYWREQAKAGKPVDGRIINTTSVSGIYGNPGQTNYGAAKAGIAAFTTIAALELIDQARADLGVRYPAES